MLRNISKGKCVQRGVVKNQRRLRARSDSYFFEMEQTGSGPQNGSWDNSITYLWFECSDSRLRIGTSFTLHSLNISCYL